LFKLFVSFLKDAELIGCEIIAIDGTKSRAHNSKKANFNQKKIDRHLVYIEERTQEYLAELAKMIYRIIALQSLRLQKNRAIKRINYAELLEEKLKGWTTPKYHRSRCESPFSSRVVVEISYNIKQWIISII
jgi:hypothetical protein